MGAPCRAPRRLPGAATEAAAKAAEYGPFPWCPLGSGPFLFSRGTEGSDPEMGRMSFTQELKELAQASELRDAGARWREALHLERELGRDRRCGGSGRWLAPELSSVRDRCRRAAT